MNVKEDDNRHKHTFILRFKDFSSVASSSPAASFDSASNFKNEKQRRS